MGIQRKQLHDVPIRHLRQSDPSTGCMYYSFSSLSGEKSLLKYQNDNSENRFMLRVQNLGYLLWPLYSNRFEVTKFNFWSKLFHYLEAIRKLKLILTVDTPNGFHTVAMEAHFVEDTFIVADPLAEKLQYFSSKEFHHSKYSNCYEVMVLDSGKLEDYKPIFSKPFVTYLQ